MSGWTDGTALVAVTGDEGTIVPHQGLKTSDLLRVEGHELLYVTMPCISSSCFGLCFYDGNGSLLSGCGVTAFPGEESGVRTAAVYVPKEAEYFRTTWLSDSDCPFSCPL